MITSPLHRGLLLCSGTFAGVLLFYQSIIWCKIVHPSEGWTQRENNIIKGESYAFGVTSSPRTVLVGSSLMSHVFMDGQGDWTGAANLAMEGGAPQTGLEILLCTQGSGGTVIVELNHTIERGNDPKILDGLFGYGLFSVRRNLSIFQTRYRPAASTVQVALRLRGILMRSFYGDTAKFEPQSRESSEFPEINMAKDRVTRGASIDRLFPEQMLPISSEVEASFRVQAGLIRRQISGLESLGWQIFLCDVPRDSRLSETTKETQIRKILREEFSPTRYRWLPPPPEQDWATRDGAHLIPAHARIFSAFLRGTLDRFVRKETH